MVLLAGNNQFISEASYDEDDSDQSRQIHFTYDWFCMMSQTWKPVGRRRQHPVFVFQWIWNYPQINFHQDIHGICYSPNWNAHTICISAGEDFVESSHQVAVNSSSTKTCVSIAIMNNRAVEETVETFMVVLHSSDPHVMLNPGATVSINDSSSKSVLIW